MMSKLAIPLALLVLATAALPAQAYYYRHNHYGWRYHGSYNYGGPHYSASDRYHNSRQLVGTR
jgi:hypothetical protein